MGEMEVYLFTCFLKFIKLQKIVSLSETILLKVLLRINVTQIVPFCEAAFFSMPNKRFFYLIVFVQAIEVFYVYIHVYCMHIYFLGIFYVYIGYVDLIKE